ncbi:MAG: hypothetical protein AAF191_12055 [Verrucomicrobiota bacterium]
MRAVQVGSGERQTRLMRELQEGLQHISVQVSAGPPEAFLLVVDGPGWHEEGGRARLEAVRKTGTPVILLWVGGAPAPIEDLQEDELITGWQGGVMPSAVLTRLHQLIPEGPTDPASEKDGKEEASPEPGRTLSPSEVVPFPPDEGKKEDPPSPASPAENLPVSASSSLPTKTVSVPASVPTSEAAADASGRKEGKTGGCLGMLLLTLLGLGLSWAWFAGDRL